MRTNVIAELPNKIVVTVMDERNIEANIGGGEGEKERERAEQTTTNKKIRRKISIINH